MSSVFATPLALAGVVGRCRPDGDAWLGIVGPFQPALRGDGSVDDIAYEARPAWSASVDNECAITTARAGTPCDDGPFCNGVGGCNNSGRSAVSQRTSARQARARDRRYSECAGRGWPAVWPKPKTEQRMISAKFSPRSSGRRASMPTARFPHFMGAVDRATSESHARPQFNTIGCARTSVRPVALIK